MDRADMLGRIDALYRARQAGDEAEVARLTSADACFELVGEKGLIDAFGAAGPLPISKAAAWLHANIAMHDLRQIEAVVEGNRVAVLSDAILSIGAREPIKMTLFDMIEFDAEGRIARFRQFADTAQIMAELTARRADAPLARPASALPGQTGERMTGAGLPHFVPGLGDAG